MKRLSGDVRILIGVSAAMVLVIVIGAFFAPAREDTDLTPSSDNSGSNGAKAAYLLLSEIGYRTGRWDRPSKDLSEVDAPHTTLILAEALPLDALKEKPGIADFLRRGGRVLATGAMSTSMLPVSNIEPPDRLFSALCYTTPQGLSAMARAGRVAMPAPARWKSNSIRARVDQSCGDDAVVVHYPFGKGEVVWWSSPAPLSNRGLKDDASLKLFLASVGEPGRLVLFDEYIHGARADLWALAAGTPVTALEWQLAAVAALLIISFGRRNGPLRAPVLAPRTSPLEFADSMGDLYRKAGAVNVATSCAERRLMQFLEHEGGIPRETLRSTPEEIAEAVEERFRYASPGFTEDLKAAQQAEFAKYSARSGLGLVRRIDEHIAKLTAIMRHSQPAPRKDGEASE
ncbi:MAG TPA: DUF4350 domain-containing protein [Acidobacteriaceae bacterium]|nr:DUF4350 domain-containing protein [Acidobacteriaceae bacterium]